MAHQLIYLQLNFIYIFIILIQKFVFSEIFNLPRSLRRPVNIARNDCETLKQWDTNLAFAVTTKNLVAKARSDKRASLLRSLPRCKRELNLHRCI